MQKCNCLITWQITPKGRYVKPCYKAIAFHISMTAPKYAINPYILVPSSRYDAEMQLPYYMANNAL